MKQGTLMNRLVMLLFFLTVCGYLVFSFYKTYNNPYPMVVAYYDTVESSVSAEGWFFRAEQRLESASGLISYRLDEGEKARAGQLVLLAYQSQEAMLQNQRLRTLEAQSAQLDFALSDDSPTGTGLDTQLRSAHASIRTVASKGDYENLASLTDRYKRLSLRQESLSSSESAAEIGFAALELHQQRAALEADMLGDYTEIFAPQSGVFSTVVDQYETVFLPELLTQELTPEEFEQIVAAPRAMEDGAVGKVATDSKWYLAMIVSEDELRLFGQGNSLSVRFTALAEAIPMSVSILGYPQDGKAVVVLSSRSDLEKTVSLRSQTCSVIFRSDRGIRVPKNALRMLEDQSVGVYTLTGFRAEFKPVTVLAEGKDFYIVRANPENNEDKRILRSGDEVIIAKAEIYHGKVVR